MNPNNPANSPCNIERSPDRTHKWQGRADGTAYCVHCAMELLKPDASEVLPPMVAEPPAEPDKRKAVRNEKAES